jgi:hypothetical protein
MAQEQDKRRPQATDQEMDDDVRQPENCQRWRVVWVDSSERMGEQGEQLGGGALAGGGGEAADAEGGANEEDGELKAAIPLFFLFLQLPLQFLAIEGNNGAKGTDELLGITLA